MFRRGLFKLQLDTSSISCKVAEENLSECFRKQQRSARTPLIDSIEGLVGLTSNTVHAAEERINAQERSDHMYSEIQRPRGPKSQPQTQRPTPANGPETTEEVSPDRETQVENVLHKIDSDHSVRAREKLQSSVLAAERDAASIVEVPLNSPTSSDSSSYIRRPMRVNVAIYDSNESQPDRSLRRVPRGGTLSSRSRSTEDVGSSSQWPSPSPSDKYESVSGSNGRRAEHNRDSIEREHDIRARMKRPRHSDKSSRGGDA